MWEQYWQDRGSPWEYDPGPAKNRSWSRLFAETPNYRGFGVAMSGNEEFRWHFGPMFYRGRLGDNQVKVLVVGQEGAQDESLSHRSFTGGTGGRMQHLLTHLGINRSYLFLNTFVYPIFGQYDGLLPIIAQHPAFADRPAPPSAVRLRRVTQRSAARHRRRPCGQGVAGQLGRGPRRHGRPRQPASRRCSVISPELRHGRRAPPRWRRQGRRGLGRSSPASRRRSTTCTQWISADPDVAAGRPRRHPARPRAYTYSSDPIPFRDFPYGVAWRLGRELDLVEPSRRPDRHPDLLRGRRLQQRRHDSRLPGCHRRHRRRLQRRRRRPAPGNHRARHTRTSTAAPVASFAALLAGRQARISVARLRVVRVEVLTVVRHRSDLPRPARPTEHPGGRRSAVARRSVHDAGTDRRRRAAPAVVPAAAGVTGRYAILRALPVDTMSDNQTAAAAAIDSAPVRALYAAVARGQARRCCCSSDHWHSDCRTTSTHGHAGGDDEIAVAVRSRCQLAGGADATAGTDLSARHHHAHVHVLPASANRSRGRICPSARLRWQGSSGNRGQQATHSGSPSFDYYKVTMPAWAAAADPPPPSASEAAAAQILRNL